ENLHLRGDIHIGKRGTDAEELLRGTTESLLDRCDRTVREQWGSRDSTQHGNTGRARKLLLVAQSGVHGDDEERRRYTGCSACPQTKCRSLRLVRRGLVLRRDRVIVDDHGDRRSALGIPGRDLLDLVDEMLADRGGELRRALRTFCRCGGLQGKRFLGGLQLDRPGQIFRRYLRAVCDYPRYPHTTHIYV